MAIEIRPSLAQMLNPQAATPARPQPAAPQTGGFANALAAQRAFFQQVTEPKITPATYTAADIARATPSAPAAASTTADPNQPLKRPGSYLNIVV